jgi:molybdate transport system substrate-binding protein
MRLPLKARVVWASLIAVLVVLNPLRLRAEDAPLVAAAADLQFALEDIAAAYKRDTGGDVKVTFGSSGNFSTQIEQGAPFQMFLSADEQFVFGLADKGLARDRGTLYAIGRIVLFAPKGSPLTGQLSAQGLKSALDKGAVKHFAIANPEHAPYGRAAQQWLETHKLWQAIQPELLIGENASQAAQFAAGGDSEGGIIPYSLALAPKIKEKGTYALLPAEDHAPLRQRMVLLKGATPTAEHFYQYMQGKTVRDIMRRYGFVLPEEASTSDR